MTSHPNRSTCRPREHLRAAGRLYPAAWKRIDQFRAARGRELPDWPEWCYAPMAAWYAIVSEDAGLNPPLPANLVGDVARLAALGAWRLGQGVYKYDTDLYRALVETPVAGAIPESILRLPEWAVYIETPGLTFTGIPLAGAFAHLEWDANTERAELRLLMDLGAWNDAMLIPCPIHLGGDLETGLYEAARVARANAVQAGAPSPGRGYEDLAGELAPVVSLLLYLCSDRPDVSDSWPPPRPRPKRTKKGWRLFPADKPAHWDVGVRIGAALRRGMANQDPNDIKETNQRRGPRPHIRRAHWHTYRVGPGRQQAVLRWLPPIPVNVDDIEALPTTIHPVEKDCDRTS